MDIYLENLSNNPILQTSAAVALLLIGATFLFVVARLLLVKGILYATRDIENVWAQVFLDKKFLSQVSWIIPTLFVHAGLNALPNVNDRTIDFLQKLAIIAFIIFTLRALVALIRSLNRAYSSLEISRNRPIKGLTQILTLLFYCSAIIFIISVILNRSPLVFLSGLGAMTAILLLIFKDTILSLVAGIQITTNDFIRVGDWIEMPQFGADGDVVDIALHAVKVQNWDKTITIIPTHKFLENAFKNWRGMQDSGGRRIKRALYIDTNTIRFLSDEDVKKFKRFTLLRNYIEQKESEISLSRTTSPVNDPEQIVNQRRLTNVGTFRAYLFNYLKAHPRIRQDMTLLVRQLAPGPTGLPIEIYVFTNTVAWGEYENIQSDIFDHVFAIASEFGLQIFQEPSGSQFVSLFENGISTVTKGENVQLEH